MSYEWYVLVESGVVPRIIVGREVALAELTRGRVLTPRELTNYKKCIAEFDVGQSLFIVGEIDGNKPDRRLWRVSSP